LSATKSAKYEKRCPLSFISNRPTAAKPGRGCAGFFLDIDLFHSFKAFKDGIQLAGGAVWLCCGWQGGEKERGCE
jgi:hypothetical protein